MFDYPTLPAAAQHLHSLLAPVQRSAPISIVPAPAASIQAQGKPVLAVSTAAHLPCLVAPGDAIAPVPEQRWDADYPMSGARSVPARFGAWLTGVDLFDAEAFGITASEAEFMDPQQRLLLHASLEVLQVRNTLFMHCTCDLHVLSLAFGANACIIVRDVQQHATAYTILGMCMCEHTCSQVVVLTRFVFPVAARAITHEPAICDGGGADIWCDFTILHTDAAYARLMRRTCHRKARRFLLAFSTSSILGCSLHMQRASVHLLLRVRH